MESIPPLKRKLATYKEPEIKILLDNMAGHQKCCGSDISNRHAAFIISIIELIGLFFFIMNLPEILVKDGYLFYTDAIQGFGVHSFAVCVAIAIVSAAAVIAQLVGLKARNYRNLIPHLVWQCLIGLFAAVQIALICCLLNSSRILRPAGFVLITFFATVIGLEVWWFTIILHCCLDFKEREMRGEKGMASPDIQMVPSITLQAASLLSLNETQIRDLSDFSIISSAASSSAYQQQSSSASSSSNNRTIDYGRQTGQTKYFSSPGHHHHHHQQLPAVVLLEADSSTICEPLPTPRNDRKQDASLADNQNSYDGMPQISCDRDAAPTVTKTSPFIANNDVDDDPISLL